MSLIRVCAVVVEKTVLTTGLVLFYGTVLERIIAALHYRVVLGHTDRSGGGAS